MTIQKIKTPWGSAGLMRTALPAADVDLATLHRDERAFAATLTAARGEEWAAGRVVLRAVCGDALAKKTPVLATPRGAPQMPDGMSASISHKRMSSVEIAAGATMLAAKGTTVGIDVELQASTRIDVAKRILTDAELSRFGKAQGVVVKRAFAIKEAVYKALDPWAKRHIGFREVEISGLIENEFGVRTVTGVTADLHRYDIEATWQSVGELIVALARVQLRS